MQSTVIVLVALLGCAFAQQDVTIVRSENENQGDGTFSWLSELSDGTKLEQSGYIKDGPDPENPIQVIQGSYSYYAPEGDLITVQYVADENGFVPTGDHLPTPPPIPAEIQKSLDIIYGSQGAASHVSNQYRRPAPPTANRRLSAPRRH